MNLSFKTGDATEPDMIEGYNIILHCVNDEGVMGSGIAATIRKKFPKAYEAYAKLFTLKASDRPTAQGQIQVVQVDKNLFVANLFGQSSCGDIAGFPAIRYDAIEEGLIRLRERFKKVTNTEIVLHTCRLGSGLAGGSWKRVEDIINRVFKDIPDLNIVVYDYPGSTYNP